MDIFTSLAIVLGLAALGGVGARFLKQPAIIGYIVAGLVLSLLGWGHGNRELLELLGKIGVTLLLFLVGLELPLNELSRLGKTALILGLGQIGITGVVGFGVCLLLGFPVSLAGYLAIALAFSSTVIVINLLSAKKDLQSLYGRLSIGLLLVQDLVAIAMLVVLVGLAKSGGVHIPILIWTVVKGLVLVVLAAWVSERIVPRFLDWLGKSPEVLFIASVGWCLGIAAVVASPWVGFTVELGGFLAGLALANAAENLQIVSKVKPLRDFFLTLFFVFLGSTVSLGQLPTIIVPALVLTGFVLIIKPLAVIVLAGSLGFSKRVAFQTGLSVAQISEFSLIVMALVDTTSLPLVGLVGLLTMAVSAYLIIHADHLYTYVGKYLPFFSTGQTSVALAPIPALAAEVYLFGHNRMGGVIRTVLEKLKLSVIVVDFDPEVLKNLATSPHIQAIYGDISDHELYEEINLANARMVISTVTDVHDNLHLLTYLKSIHQNRPASVVVAATAADAHQLYKHGADLVVIPHLLGGEYLADFFKHKGIDRKMVAHWGQLHKASLASK